MLAMFRKMLPMCAKFKINPPAFLIERRYKFGSLLISRATQLSGTVES